MNIIQKLAWKALGISTNQLYEVLFRFMGKDMPVWMDDRFEQYLEQGYGGNIDVYSIINRIQELGAGIPWKVQEKRGDKYVDIADHEVQLLMEKPNPLQSGRELRQAIIGYFLATGNGYFFAPFLENGLNKGKTKELYCMPSQLTQIEFGSKQQPVAGYSLTYAPEETIDARFVGHIKKWNPFANNAEQLYGLSPLRAARQSVKLSDSAMTASVKAFENGGPAGILSRDSGSDDEFSEEQKSKLERDYARKYAGPENFRRILMTGAQVKWQQIGLSPVDLGIIEQDKMNFGKLCNVYGVPVQIFNDTSASTDNNYEMALKQAYLHAVLPVLDAMRDKLNAWLMPGYGEKYYLTYDTSGIEVLQHDKKEMVEWLRQAFWIKGTRKQQIMGEQEDPEMDRYFDANGQPILTVEELNQQAAAMQEQEVDEAVKELAKYGLSDYSKNGKHN